MYALIEGSDNNLPMTGFRVPFDKNTTVYDCDGEGWRFVNTDANDGEVPSKAIRDKYSADQMEAIKFLR